MQYNIRLSREDIGFGEFCRLLKGLMPDTPLGRAVEIRAEKRAEIIKNFGPYESKIRADWRRFLLGGVECNPNNWEGEIVKLQGTLARAFAQRR